MSGKKYGNQMYNFCFKEHKKKTSKNFDCQKLKLCSKLPSRNFTTKLMRNS
ncbi:unknown protein [Parachlamydia acanthamoebae UV-7]|uniref:Uncharacterized protein n=2 Tax=Parachlamydia acanthamoebae TaxID=83552 RepID=F8KZY2_PARAV|nr:hypothetical protein DB43_FS00310 [Parachlamydia acanthamoebae]CCB86491.1 unknown protein [Parachlamydia acanthamoebae UV-7]